MLQSTSPSKRLAFLRNPASSSSKTAQAKPHNSPGALKERREVDPTLPSLLANLPTELLHSIIDCVAAGCKRAGDRTDLISLASVNHRLRDIAFGVLFKKITLYEPVDWRRYPQFAKNVASFTTHCVPHAESMSELTRVEQFRYWCNTPLSAKTSQAVHDLPSLRRVHFDVTLIEKGWTMPEDIEDLTLSFRDDRDVHGDHPPDRMEQYSEDEIWETIVEMGLFVCRSASTLRRLKLKLLLPIDTLAKPFWPHLDTVSLVRSFPSSRLKAFFRNAPNLTDLTIHGRPHGRFWLDESDRGVLPNLKRLVIAAVPLEGDALLPLLPNLEYFRVEDQVSYAAGFYIVKALKDSKLRELHLEPVETSVLWLGTVADHLPHLEVLSCRHSRMKFISLTDTADAFLEGVGRLKKLRSLSLGWHLDVQANDSAADVAVRSASIELEGDSSARSQGNVRGEGSADPSRPDPQSPASDTDVDSDESAPASPMSTSFSSASSSFSEVTESTASSPAPSTLSLSSAGSTGALTKFYQDRSFRESLLGAWNVRSDRRYAAATLKVAGLCPDLEQIEWKREGVDGGQVSVWRIGRTPDGMPFVLDDAVGWGIEEPFPSTSVAFMGA